MRSGIQKILIRLANAADRLRVRCISCPNRKVQALDHAAHCDVQAPVPDGQRLGMVHSFSVDLGLWMPLPRIASLVVLIQTAPAISLWRIVDAESNARILARGEGADYEIFDTGSSHLRSLGTWQRPRFQRNKRLWLPKGGLR